MSEKKLNYIVGFAIHDGWPTWIGYCPRSYNDLEVVSVCIGEGPVAFGVTKPPKDILQFVYRQTISKEVNGKIEILYVEELPGWFERKCFEVKCEWFVPMVKRMAEGEKVPLEEINTAYHANNGINITTVPIWARFPRL